MLPNDVYNSACSTTPKGPTCPEGSGPDYDFGSPAILVTTAGGRDLLLAGQKSGIVWAFDPDKNGEIVWQTRVAQGGINGGVQWGMASDGEHVYAATSDVVVDPDARRRACSIRQRGGGLTALRIADGSTGLARRRQPCGATAQLQSRRNRPRSPRFPASCSRGRSTATCARYSTRDGAVIWDFDTVQDYETVNGVKASGGAIDGPGAVVVERHGVRQLRLHAVRRRAGQRAACVRGRTRFMPVLFWTRVSGGSRPSSTRVNQFTAGDWSCVGTSR